MTEVVDIRTVPVKNSYNMTNMFLFRRDVVLETYRSGRIRLDSVFVDDCTEISNFRLVEMRFLEVYGNVELGYYVKEDY